MPTLFRTKAKEKGDTKGKNFQPLALTKSEGFQSWRVELRFKSINFAISHFIHSKLQKVAEKFCTF
jgi:hypothetical protein